MLPAPTPSPVEEVLVEERVVVGERLGESGQPGGRDLLQGRLVRLVPGKEPRHVTSRHVTSRHVTSRHVTPGQARPRHVTSRMVT